MRIKYLESRARKTGTIYVVNPTKNVRELIGAEYRAFGQDADAAIAYARDVAKRYEDARKGRYVTPMAKRTTIASAWDEYMASSAFAYLATNSRGVYRYNMRFAVRLPFRKAELGDAPLDTVSPGEAETLMDDLRRLHGDSRAVEVAKVLRILYNFAFRRGYITTANPFARLKLKAPKSRDVVWTPDQIAHFVKTADEMGLPQIGTHILLCYELCQRPGDVRQLRWADLAHGVFSFSQEKTHIRVHAPVSPSLLQRLAEHRHPYKHVIVDENGNPYDRYIYRLVAQVRQKAGLPEVIWASDLRRTGSTELMEAHATEDEARAITGHQSRAKLNIYSQSTRKVAVNAANKRFAKQA